MFEHATLQESYTGSLIAGKGKTLNNIRVVMERSKVPYGDWARVRFGAGTPWRRCWCVISPPNEKEFQKQQKSLKKRSAYDRPGNLKGDIKFYDGKKTKKAKPIATITDAYSAYAIYPQSKPLIDQSTLVKLEGRITIHSTPESSTEGFVFVMPEVHAAVSGFEMMLRWLFPVFDTFGLYGRPNRLIADTIDTRSLMFAMPKEKRYGYLDILDVATLVHTDGSESWSEREWRKQMKEVTSRRMRNAPTRTSSKLGSRRGLNNSMPSRNGTLNHDNASTRSSPSIRHAHNQSTDAVFSTSPQRAGTNPGVTVPFTPPHNYHARSASETVAFETPRHRQEPYVPSRLSLDNRRGISETPPLPPAHAQGVRKDSQPFQSGRQQQFDGANDRSSSSESERRLPMLDTNAQDIKHDMESNLSPSPVVAPPAFNHQPGAKPQNRPYHSAELRQANNRMSTATLAQLVDSSNMGGAAAAGAAAAWKTKRSEDQGSRGVIDDANSWRNNADQGTPMHEGMVADSRTQSNPPPVPRHGLPRQAQRPAGPPRDASSGKSVTRKPVPSPNGRPSTSHAVASPNAIDQARPSTSPAPYSPEQETRFDSFRHAVDQEALDRVMARVPTQSSEGDARQSIDDNDSVATPDYASTRKSTDTKRSDKSIPRRGVLKTVGTVEPAKQEVVIGDARYTQEHPLPTNPDIPTVDFGPTHYPGTKGRPNTSGTMSRTPSDNLVLQQEKRYSQGGQHSRSRSRSPNPNSMAWQPGATIGGRQSPGGRITPEQFVQQRAANRTPIYAHQRTPSSGSLPMRRLSSGDWSAQLRDAPPRPNSRGASPLLGQQDHSAHQDYSAHMSAREQEHVARVTGSSLLNMTNQSKTPPPGTGLIGAIEAREREKRDMKEGLSGQMVQQEIARRTEQARLQTQAQMKAQQHAQQAAQMAFQQQQFAQYGGQSQPGPYGGWSSPQPGMQQQQGGVPQGQYWPGMPYQQQGGYYGQQQQQHDGRR